MKMDKRLRKMVYAEFDIDAQDVAFPSDFSELRRWTVPDTAGYAQRIVRVPIDQLPTGLTAGRPQFFSMYERPVEEPIDAPAGWAARIAPVPDRLYVTFFSYFRTFDPLGPGGDAVSNWLLAEFPNIYVNAVMREAAVLMRDAALVQYHEDEYQRLVHAAGLWKERRTNEGGPTTAVPSLVIGG